MPAVARLNDSESGTTTSDYHCYYVNGSPIYDSKGNITGYNQVLQCDPPASYSGSISGNVSSNVFVNGVAVATQGSTTTETLPYSSGTGTISGGSSTVFVNGKGIARNGDSVSPSNGTANLSSGSSNVFAN